MTYDYGLTVALAFAAAVVYAFLMGVYSERMGWTKHFWRKSRPRYHKTGYAPSFNLPPAIDRAKWDMAFFAFMARAVWLDDTSEGAFYRAGHVTLAGYRKFLPLMFYCGLWARNTASRKPPVWRWLPDERIEAVRRVRWSIRAGRLTPPYPDANVPVVE